MMKFVVAAVVLLHLCHANNWRNEVMGRLRKVTRDHFTFPPVMLIPSNKMRHNATACESTFTSQLKHVLSKVKAKTSERENVLHELKGLLTRAGQVDAGCQMRNRTTARLLEPMDPYISFLKTLNSTPNKR